MRHILHLDAIQQSISVLGANMRRSGRSAATATNGCHLGVTLTHTATLLTQSLPRVPKRSTGRMSGQAERERSAVKPGFRLF